MRSALATAVVLLLAGCASPPPPQALPNPAPSGAPEVCAEEVATPPVVDGVENEASWSQAPETEIAIEGAESLGCRVKAVVHRGTLYLLLRWKDTTEDRKTAADKARDWSYSGPRGVWNPRSIGDWVTLTFPILGPFEGSSDVPVEGSKDVWRWDAILSDRLGHARDGTLTRTLKNRPGGPEVGVARALGGGVMYDYLDDDDGFPNSPKEPPARSAADVLARGHWQDGEWTVEIARALSTGQADDVDFAGLRTCPFRVTVRDLSELDSRGHPAAKSSPILNLLLPPPVLEDRQGPFPDPRGSPRE